MQCWMQEIQSDFGITKSGDTTYDNKINGYNLKIHIINVIIYIILFYCIPILYRMKGLS